MMDVLVQGNSVLQFLLFTCLLVASLMFDSTYVICLCVMFMILLSSALSFEEITTQDHVHHHQCFSVVVKFCTVATHQKKKTEIFCHSCFVILPKKLRNSWFFEEMLSRFCCPHESLTTFFSVWIKN
jgi:hypothetical protein